MKRILLTTLVLILSGCVTDMKMTVPTDIQASTQVIVASDRSMWSGALADETFTLGPYKIIEVDRDWDRKSSSTFSINKVDVGSGDMKGGYTYKISAQDQTFQGQCTSKADKESLGIKSLTLQTRRFNLSCTCNMKNTFMSNVHIQAKNQDDYSGTFKVFDQSYKIKPLKEREGITASGPSGYRVDGDTPIGAVEVLKPGRIWLGNTLNNKDQHALTCGFVGLMLYLPPEIK